MKWGVLLSIILLSLVIGTSIYLLQYSKPHPSPGNPTPTQQVSTPTQSVSPSSTINFCTPAQLQASLTLSPAAGNIYGTFVLKNMSQTSCHIQGGAFISVHYDTTSIKNITVTHEGQTQPQPFLLTSGQSIYSQLHYPNGPQCQSVGLKSVPISFTYAISPTSTITFQNQEGSTTQNVQTCNSPTDITDIQIWKLSSQPITPLNP